MLLDRNETKTRTIDIETVCPGSEYSKKFLEGMLSRMAMSHFKYGKIADAYPAKVNAVDSLRLRLDKYAETGNTEYLMDAANFAMIEFMHPSRTRCPLHADRFRRKPRTRRQQRWRQPERKRFPHLVRLTCNARSVTPL